MEVAPPTPTTPHLDPISTLSSRPNTRFSGQRRDQTSPRPTLPPLTHIHRPSQRRRHTSHHHRPLPSKQTHSSTFLPTGQPFQSCQTTRPSSLHGLPRHQGGLHPHPHPPQSPQVPGLQLSQQPLLFPSPPIRSQLRPIYIHQGTCVASTTVTKQRNHDCRLLRRPPLMAQESLHPQAPPHPFHSLPSTAGFPYSSPQVPPVTITSTRLAGNLLAGANRPLVHATVLPTRDSTNCTPPLNRPHHHSSPMGGVCWQAQFRVPSPHPPPRPPSTFSQSLSHCTSISQGLPSSPSSYLTSSPTPLDVSFPLGRKTSLPSNSSTPTNVVGRLTPRVGRHNGGQHYSKGPMVSCRNITAYQPPRTSSDSPSNLPIRPPKHSTHHLHGQRGGEARPPRSPSTLPLAPTRIYVPRTELPSPTYPSLCVQNSFSPERRRRWPQQEGTSGHRMAPSPGGLSLHSPVGRPSDSRSIRNSPEHSSSSVCSPFPSPSGVGYRRSCHRLATLRKYLRLSSNQPHSPAPSTSSRLSRQSSIGGTLETSSHLVSNPSSACQRQTPTTHDSLPTLPTGDCTALLRAVRTMDRLSFLRHCLTPSRPPAVINTLLSAYRKSSTRQQEVAWKALQSWLPESAPTIDLSLILEFLQHLFDDKLLAPKTIQCYLSSLSWPLTRAFQIDFTHIDISRLMKGFFHLRPPQQILSPQWDLGEALRFYETLPAPLSSRQLFLKTLFLVALAAGNRCSELAALLRTGIVSSQAGITLALKPSFLFKNQSERRIPPPIFIPIFPSSNLCPVSTLRLYLTNSTPTDDSTSLFIHPKSSKPLDSSRLRYWMIQAIKFAQTERQVVKPHDLRKFAYSANWARRTNLHSIITHGFWSSAQPFLNNYLVSLPDALPQFVAAGSVI